MLQFRSLLLLPIKMLLEADDHPMLLSYLKLLIPDHCLLLLCFAHKSLYLASEPSIIIFESLKKFLHLLELLLGDQRGRR